MQRIISGIGVAIGVAVAACGRESPADCAGGLIPPAWVEQQTPLVRSIVVPEGAVESAAEFVLRLGRDRIDVTDVSSADPFAPPARVHTFSDSTLIVSGAGGLMTVSGDFRATGRIGAVPGLYGIGYATGVARWSGDTIVTFDANGARLIWYHPELGYARTQLIPSLLRDLHWATPVGVLPGARLVFHGQWTPRLATLETVVRPVAPVAILDPGSTEPRIIARPPGYELRATRIRGANAEPVRRGRKSVVAVWDTLIVIGDGALDYRLDVLNGDGAWVAQLCVPRDPAITRERSRDVDGGIAPYEAIYVTDSGVLWVVDGMTSMDTEWTAIGFTQSGEVVGLLRGPGNVPPAAITDERVYVQRTDSIGFVWLQEYEIGR